MHYEISNYVLIYNTSYFSIADLVPQDRPLCGFQIPFFPGIAYNSLVPFLIHLFFFLSK